MEIARGSVLRCRIGYKNDEATILIDDKEIGMHELGELLSVFEGWDLRLIVVPEDETHLPPLIEVTDPDERVEAPIMFAGKFISKTEH